MTTKHEKAKKNSAKAYELKGLIVHIRKRKSQTATEFTEGVEGLELRAAFEKLARS